MTIFIVSLYITPAPANDSSTNPSPVTTFGKYLSQAEAGDHKPQNLVGYMLFYGEGVERNYELSHAWFHEAAEHGNVNAQRNLGLFHAKVLSRIPEEYYNPEEANYWFTLLGVNISISSVADAPENFAFEPLYFQEGEPLVIGEKVFQTFCAGCHGFQGISTYKYAPSFALGERMDKTDEELAASIRDGIGLMPSWGGTLSARLRKNALQYIRQGLAGKLSDSNSDVSASKKPVITSQSSGAEIYSEFCSGCHGFSGIAHYVNSPSFVLGQRLDKSDAELAKSIISGVGAMPSWENMLGAQQVQTVIDYIRTFEGRYSTGIEFELEPRKGTFLEFMPVGGW